MPPVPRNRTSSARPPRRPDPWWGAGDPPHELWPGVSLTFDPVWSTANNRWQTDQGRFYFDMEAADRAADFFPLYLSHHIGEYAGQPFILRDDQAKLLTRPIFGWKREGLRRFRKVFAFCPKGWGKSPWASGTGIYLARCDGEAAAEVYAVAADRGQARTVHDNAKIMVENTPELFEGCEILKDAILWRHLHCTYQVLSSDASTAHGKRPHGVIFDEMHAQKNRDLFEALWKSMVKRLQPLMMIITHAGSDDEGICYEEYDLAKRVLNSAVSLETVLPVIFEIKQGEDWTSPAVWRRLNPGHGTTVKHDAIVAECLEAQIEPRKRNDFLRYHTNLWTNQATAWIPIEWWDACETTFTDAELVGLDVGAGLDLAQKWDLAAFVLAFKKPLVDTKTIEVKAEEDTGQIVTKTIALNYELYLRPYFWIPENTLRQHEREDGVPYSLWVDQGLVTATPGDIIDYTQIYRDISTRILPRYPKLKQGWVGYDPAFATDLSTKLKDLAGLQIVEVLQTFRVISEPAQIMEALIKGKRIHHDGHRVLRWNWENASVKTDDDGRIRPVKPRNASKRIDGAVATILAQKALTNDPVHEPQLFIFAGKGK